MIKNDRGIKERIMKRSGYGMKRFMAMLLSACLILPQGAFSAYAAGEPGEPAAVEVIELSADEADTASASDASAAGEAVKTGEEKAPAATESDALFDEDGFLLDGEVADDIEADGEVAEKAEASAPDAIEAPELQILPEIIELPALKEAWVPVTDVVMNTPEKTMVKGKTFQLVAWAQPTNASNRDVTWSTSNPAAATVDSTGLVTAVERGNATITATTVDGGYTATCSIKVTVPVTGVNLNSYVKTMVAGKTFQLAAWPQPANATNKQVSWSSSNTDVATVSSTGLVKALKGGKATITVKTADGGHTATCSITVAVPVTGVKLNASSKTMVTGKTFQLAAWPQPANATDKSVTWSSSNTAVATVSSMGLVKAVKGGKATITVKTVDGGHTATCSITVNTSVTGVKLNTTAKTIVAGKTFQLVAWPQPANATNKKVTWSSSNTAVATVSATGLVKAVKGGKATITVKTADGGHTATCSITVAIPVTSVKLNTTAKSMVLGNTFQLVAWPQPANATNKKVSWSSSNTAVATVSSTGLVRALKTGTATITVKTADGGHSATCRITVVIPVISVKINTTAKTIAPGSTFQLVAWPQPANATNKKVTWSSSNTAVATVSSTGLVRSVKNGTATITVKTADGGKTAACRITVRVPVTGVKISTTSHTVVKGSSFQLTAWPQPADATNKNVTWSSSNTAVATVSSTGLVRGVKGGTATITVKTADGGFTQRCNILVKIPVTDVEISTHSQTIQTGTTFQLVAWPQPADATYKKVYWETSNSSVATVSSTGLVRGLRPGNASITVRTDDGGYTEICRIQVVEYKEVHVTGVRINTTSETIYRGNSFQLVAWPQPANATDKRVNWTTSNSSVATVTSTGLVTGHRTGTADITATTVDGGCRIVCRIRVKEPEVIHVFDVEINTHSISLYRGEVFQLVAWPQPVDATNKNVTWSSTDTSVARVSSTGKVTAVGRGVCNVLVRTEDGGYTEVCRVNVE